MYASEIRAGGNEPFHFVSFRCILQNETKWIFTVVGLIAPKVQGS